MDTLQDTTELKRADDLIALFLPEGQLILYCCGRRRMLQISAAALTILKGFGDWRAYGDVRDAIARGPGGPSAAAGDFAGCVESLCEAGMLLRRGTASDPDLNVFHWSGFSPAHEEDGHADVSDRWFHCKFEDDGRLASNAYRYIEWAALKRLLVETGSLANVRVLDAGCGSGFYAVWCAKQGALVSGVDSNRQLLARARALAGRECVDVALREADLSQSDSLDDYPDSHFDRVICVDTLVNMLHMADLDAAGVRSFLGRLKRVVATEGRVLVVDPHPVFAFLPRLGSVTHPFTILTEYAHKTSRYSRIMPSLHQYLRMFLDVGWAIERLEELYPEPAYEHVDSRSFHYYRQFPGWLALVVRKA